MKNILSTTIVLTLLSTPVAFADSYKRIKKAADFNAIVVDKNLAFGPNTAIICSNGKTDGKLKKQGKYYGAWAWQNGYYCRNLVINKKETGTNCQLVEFDGKQLRFTKDKGKGGVTNLTFI
jgi:hypothetical protein